MPRIRIALVVLLILGISFPLSAQKRDAFFDKILKTASPLAIPLEQAKIEGLEEKEPPEGTWTYEKLAKYKAYKEKGEGAITAGKFIQASNKKGLYGVNYFAYSGEGKEASYFYVLIVSVDTNGPDFRISNSYLFTEERALGDWWMNTYSFYKSKAKNKIPPKFRHPNCPPPPFRPGRE